MTSTHSDYITLIRDSIATLKEDPTCIFSTKEEWEVLRELKVEKSVKPVLKIKPTVSVGQAPVRMRPSLVSQEIHAPIIDRPSENVCEKKIPQQNVQKEDTNIKNFLQNASVALTEHIPDDSHATKEMSAYKEYMGVLDVIIFACDADPDTLLLLKNLSKSIDQKLGPVKVLRADKWEKEEQWDAFLTKNPIKLLIASSGISQLKGAMRHYISPNGGLSSFLKNIPLIILSPSAVYTQSPKDKLILWNQICAILKKAT